MQNAIEVENLKVVFPDRGRMIRAVEGVNLTVKKGECLALVGESGCGKSMTSLSCMKLQPSLAAVRLDQLCICGEDVTDYTDRQMQALRGSKISMIFQDALTALNPVMTIGKQMDEIYRCHEKISKKEAKMRSIKAKAVGIPDAELRYHAFPHELSGGMRQRVLIAMAFACEPEVIIADEPTTALDVTIQAQILELLSKMQKEKQTALLLITHDLSVVRSMADRIAVMYSGKIVEEAPAKELLENPLHPYTKGLIAAVARLDDDKKEFVQIPGHLPDPADKPAGCYFHPRCPYAATACRKTMPLLTQNEQGRKVRCYRAENLKNNRDILLETRNLSVEFPLKKKSFFEKQKMLSAVSDVSIQIRKGETFGLVGRAAAANQRLPMQRLVL